MMSAGLGLSRALLEHSPQFSDLPEYERARVLDQLQADHAFAFQKYDNAFPNLASYESSAPRRDERQGTVSDTHPTRSYPLAAPLMLITTLAHSSTP